MLGSVAAAAFMQNRIARSLSRSQKECNCTRKSLPALSHCRPPRRSRGRGAAGAGPVRPRASAQKCECAMRCAWREHLGTDRLFSFPPMSPRQRETQSGFVDAPHKTFFRHFGKIRGENAPHRPDTLNVRSISFMAWKDSWNHLS